MPSPASARPGGSDLDGRLADGLAGDHLLESLVAQRSTLLGELVAALGDALRRRPAGRCLRQPPPRRGPRPGRRSRPARGRSRGSRPRGRWRRPRRRAAASPRSARNADRTGMPIRRTTTATALELTADARDLEPAFEVVLADRPDDRAEDRDVLRRRQELGALLDVVDARCRDHVAERRDAARDEQLVRAPGQVAGALDDGGTADRGGIGRLPRPRRDPPRRARRRRSPRPRRRGRQAQRCRVARATRRWTWPVPWGLALVREAVGALAAGGGFAQWTWRRPWSRDWPRSSPRSSSRPWSRAWRPAFVVDLAGRLPLAPVFGGMIKHPPRSSPARSSRRRRSDPEG